MGKIVPEGYTTLLDAIYASAEVQYAGAAFSDAVKRVRAQGYTSRFSVEELEASAAAFWEQVDSSHMPRPGSKPIKIWAEQPGKGMVEIDPALLHTVPFARSYRVASLAYLRPGNPAYEEFAARFGPSLSQVQILVRTSDLQRATQNLRRTRRRIDARVGGVPIRPIGRPAKREAVEAALIQIVESQKWHGAEALKKLTNLLGRPPHSIGTSDSTVARVLDGLHQKTGDRRFFRLRKVAKVSA